MSASRPSARPSVASLPAAPRAAVRRCVVVTGGAGFIGSHLVRWLRKRGDEVTVIDDLSTGRRANIAALLDPRCRLVRAKVSRALAVHPRLLDGAAQVYHLAAAVGVQLVVDEPAATIRNNVEETAALLEAAARRRVPVLIASSSEVYGKNPRMPLSEDDDLAYGPTTSPRWSYGMSKALDEHLALCRHAKDGLGVVIVRLFNTIGPRQIGRYGMVVPRFVRQALAGEDLEIHGDGRQTRSFCDVRDVVAAMTALMDDPSHYGQVFNLGSDHEVTIDELADRVLALVASIRRGPIRARGRGRPPGKRYVPYAQAYDAGFEDPPRRVPDLTRIRRAIGLRPRYALDQTLRELVELALTERNAERPGHSPRGDGPTRRQRPR